MLKAGLIGTIAAVIGVAVTVLIGDAVSGPLMVTSPGADGPEELAMGAALSGTVVGGIAGIILAALSKRFLPQAAIAFVGICIVGLIAYGIFSFTATESIATGIWLNVMHIVAAIPIVGLLTKTIQDANAS